MLIRLVQTSLRFSPKIFQRPLVLRCYTMAPPPTLGDKTIPDLDSLINNNKVAIFSKTWCPFCKKVKSAFDSLGEKYYVLELDIDPNGTEIAAKLQEKTGQKTVPQVFVAGHHLGGCTDTMVAKKDGRLKELLEKGAVNNYDYDLAVIGGGSGGLAASKAAAALGKKVVVFDFVQPSPIGTTWGLGGTCVNVGCIPKKLMHKASLLGEDFKDAPFFGWDIKNVNHDWSTMITAIQDYIKSLNFGYRTTLVQKSVTYINAYAQFIEPNKLKTVNKKGVEKEVTARNFIIAVGGRPMYPDIPGAKEYGITSDDLFSLPKSPGKTLLVGASYIALECAGFLAGLNLDVTVMVRSILLRSFDQQMAGKIGEHMAEHGVKFLEKCVPVKVECIRQAQDDVPAELKVTYSFADGKQEEVICNTVIFAVGREACTQNLGLKHAGVDVNPRNGKIVANKEEQSSAEHIYAIGDVLDGQLELTPVAIQAGKLLAKRLYADAGTLTDYLNIPTTVFTPLEYACVGLPEEDAIAKFGQDNIEIYHTHFQPLEFALSGRDKNKSYGKLVCVKKHEESGKKELVVGLHMLGPNAGEVVQGFAIGLKLGATKSDFANLIGIHPTCAETFTTMSITKASGENVDGASC